MNSAEYITGALHCSRNLKMYVFKINVSWKRRLIHAACKIVNVNVNVRHTYWAPLDPVTEALHAVELTLFLWHMPESVAEHSFVGCNLPSICIPSYSLLCSVALIPNVLLRRDEGSGKPCAAVIEALQHISPHSGLEPGWLDSESWAVITTLPLHLL